MTCRLTVAIVDYGMGNVKSIENAINHIGDFNITVTENRTVIQNADVIILPGVGAFPDAIKKLADKNLIDDLHDAVQQQKKPTLGICLGMQLLFESSEEKKLTRGLGWIPGEVLYLNPGAGLRVPHIGWNSLQIISDNSIFSFLNEDKDFYFVHSLHARCDKRYVLATCDYGDAIAAAVKNDNVIGMQFHPEKSQRNGLAALRAFFNWARLYIRENHAQNPSNCLHNY